MDPFAGFRQQMLAQGISRKEIDDFLAPKQQELEQQAQFQLGLGGILGLEDLAKSNPLLAFQLQQAGVPLKEDKPEAQKTAEYGRNELLTAATNALTGLQQARKAGRDVTGFGPGFLRGIREEIGAVDPVSTRVRALIGKVGAAYAFSTGGKQFTETELKLITPLLPDPNDDEQVVEDKLTILASTLQKIGQAKQGNVQGLNNQSMGISPQDAELQSLIGLNPQAQTGGKIPKPKLSKLGQFQEPQNFIESLLQGAAKPLTDTLRTIGGAGFELARAATGAGVKGEASEPIQNLSRAFLGRDLQRGENPFLQEEELNQYSEDPMGALANQYGRSAALAAPAVVRGGAATTPLFESLGIKAGMGPVTSLGGALAQGAVGGGLLGAAEPVGGNISARAGNIAKYAAIGAALSGAGYGISKIKGGNLPISQKNAGKKIDDALKVYGDDPVETQSFWDKVASKAKSKTVGRNYLGFQKEFQTDLARYSNPDGTLKELTIRDLSNIQQGANVVYAKAPKGIGKIYAKVVGDTAREIIENQAPGLGVANRAYGRIAGVSNFTSKLPGRIATGAAYSIPTALLFKTLNIGGGGP